MQKLIVTATLLALALYAALLAGLWLWQERLIFLPARLPANHRFDLGPDVHETWVEVPGARLNALHLQLPKPDGVVVYLHGNAGNLQGWFSNPGFWRRANLDLFMIDYRGYGKSSGRVESEAQLHADARAAWDTVAARYTGQRPGQRRIVVGRSLGTGLAAALAAEVRPDLTVLISPYESLQALQREHFAWVPGFVLRYPLRTDHALPRIAGPVLLIHGQDDDLIAPAHSERLQRLRPGTQRLVVAGAGHNDLQDFPAYLEGLLEMLRTMPAR